MYSHPKLLRYKRWPKGWLQLLLPQSQYISSEKERELSHIKRILNSYPKILQPPEDPLCSYFTISQLPLPPHNPTNPQHASSHASSNVPPSSSTSFPPSPTHSTYSPRHKSAGHHPHMDYHTPPHPPSSRSHPICPRRNIGCRTRCQRCCSLPRSRRSRSRRGWSHGPSSGECGWCGRE